MKKLILSAIMGAAVLNGCTTVKSSDIDLEVKSSRDVKITQVAVSHEGTVLKITGSLRPNSSVVTRAGHVDADFIGTDGAVLKSVRATGHIVTFSRKSTRRPTFSVAAEAAGVSRVRLTHHPDKMQQCEK